MILRRAAYLLGLRRGATLVKRAMQFGSRVSNKRVAGYLDMSTRVRIATIVNPNFLRPSSLPSIEDNNNNNNDDVTTTAAMSSRQRRGKGGNNKDKFASKSAHQVPTTLSKKHNRNIKDAVWAAEAALAGTSTAVTQLPSTTVVSSTSVVHPPTK
jgi:hypothetical protein